jgi:hypothetical protein
LKQAEPIELYELGSDIGEHKNFAQAEPEMAKKLTEMIDASRTPHSYWPARGSEGRTAGKRSRRLAVLGGPAVTTSARRGIGFREFAGIPAESHSQKHPDSPVMRLAGGGIRRRLTFCPDG